MKIFLILLVMCFMAMPVRSNEVVKYGSGKRNLHTIIKLLLGKVCLCKCGTPNFIVETYKTNHMNVIQSEGIRFSQNDFHNDGNTSDIAEYNKYLDQENNNLITNLTNESDTSLDKEFDNVSGIKTKFHLSHQEKLIGGDVLEANGFPWLVLIMVKGVVTAGGAIITDRHIVSAASPFVGVSPSDVKISIGVHDRCKSDIHTWNISVSTISIHPSYLDIDHRHDIAILTLSGKLIFNKVVSPICISNNSATQRINWIASWLSPVVPSFLIPKPEANCVPKLVRLPTLTTDECLRASPPTSFLLTHDKFCLGPFGVRSQICSGDVGSPVQFLNSEGYFELTGVLIDMNACDTTKPVLFIRIDKHIAWIKSITTNGCVCDI